MFHGIWCFRWSDIPRKLLFGPTTYLKNESRSEFETKRSEKNIATLIWNFDVLRLGEHRKQQKN